MFGERFANDPTLLSSLSPPPGRFPESFSCVADFSRVNTLERNHAMTNVGAADRLIRTLAACMLLLAAIFLEIPVMGRVGLAGMGLYLLGTALSGTCLGY